MARSEHDLCSYELGNGRVIALGYYNDELRIRLKELTKRADGTYMQKDFKACSLKGDQWNLIMSSRAEISARVDVLKGLAQNGETQTWPLGEGKYVDVYKFGKHSTTLVDVRQFYTGDGQRKPTRYGIALKVKEWKELCGLCDAVGKKMVELTDGGLIERLLIDIMTRYIIVRITVVAQQNCHGCSIEHGSQNQHMVGGCLSDWVDIVDLYFDELFNSMPRDLITSTLMEVVRGLNLPTVSNAEELYKKQRRTTGKEKLRYSVTDGAVGDEIWNAKVEAVLEMRMTDNY
jgi:hypothetical protein